MRLGVESWKTVFERFKNMSSICDLWGEYIISRTRWSRVVIGVGFLDSVAQPVCEMGKMMCQKGCMRCREITSCKEIRNDRSTLQECPDEPAGINQTDLLSQLRNKGKDRVVRGVEKYVSSKEMWNPLWTWPECQEEPLVRNQADIWGELRNGAVLHHGRLWNRLQLLLLLSLLDTFVLFSSEIVGCRVNSHWVKTIAEWSMTLEKGFLRRYSRWSRQGYQCWYLPCE